MSDALPTSQAQEQAFASYKKVEQHALAIVAEMRSLSVKPVDIELALLTALFELHKGKLPPTTVAKIVAGHIETLVPYYQELLKVKREPQN